MSNAQWEKLLDALTDGVEELHVNYKLIHSDEIKRTSFRASDFSPFFVEPILYKEVEWMEISSNYEDWLNPNNHKAGINTYKQNLDELEK